MIEYGLMDVHSVVMVLRRIASKLKPRKIGSLSEDRPEPAGMVPRPALKGSITKPFAIDSSDDESVIMAGPTTSSTGTFNKAAYDR